MRGDTKPHMCHILFGGVIMANSFTDSLLLFIVRLGDIILKIVSFCVDCMLNASHYKLFVIIMLLVMAALLFVLHKQNNLSLLNALVYYMFLRPIISVLFCVLIELCQLFLEMIAAFSAVCVPVCLFALLVILVAFVLMLRVLR